MSDFDFWQGRWRGANRKLVDVVDPECAEWVEFEAECLAQSTLGGLGSVDTFLAEDMPGRGRVEGMTVRLLDPATGIWRIWWVSTGAPGDLGIPVEGRWTDGVGRFFADEELGGHQVKVQFQWTVQSEDEAQWQQSFSYDNGTTWKTNWTATHKRIE